MPDEPKPDKFAELGAALEQLTIDRPDPPKLVMTLEEAIALAEQLEAAQGNPEKS